MEEKDLTIIIPHLVGNKLSERSLSMCLDSIKNFTGAISVAENGGDSGYPQGQCKAVNRKAKKAITEWLMIMNDDMIASPGWFQELTYWIENYGLLVASPNLVEPRKGAPPFIEHFCGGLGTIGTEPDFNLQCFLDFVKNHKEHNNKPDTFIEFGWNLPFIIRKDVWDTVGGYDEAYDPWSSNSDSDLQYKLMYAGITPKRIRSVLFYHFSQTSGTFHPDNQAYVQENHRKFTEKWGVERASSPDIWYKPSVSWDNVKFKADWKGKFENNH